MSKTGKVLDSFKENTKECAEKGNKTRQYLEDELKKIEDKLKLLMEELEKLNTASNSPEEEERVLKSKIIQDYQVKNNINYFSYILSSFVGFFYKASSSSIPCISTATNNMSTTTTTYPLPTKFLPTISS